MKDEAKKRIQKLIEKYKNLSELERRKYNEQQTKDHFIRPLFEALGWDFENDVWAETSVSKKRGDYAFKIDSITKFFIEAKQLSVNLDEIRWAEQAIWYAYHKSVPWAILTDFKSIKVFNAEWDEQDAERSLVLEINYQNYLTDERLWWLSKESVEKGELDKYAEENFKKPKRAAVDKQLVADLLRWRDKLFNDFHGYNPLIKDKQKISENVQRFLNRVIFIRTCEDRGFEDRVLQEAVRNWEERGHRNNDLVNQLRKIFTDFDKNYDSKLFEERISFDSEGFKVVDWTLTEVIKETYKSSKGIHWNFDDIKDDVMGSIYEQYLGFIQKKEKSNEEVDKSKRKSQGIYYTPGYIVDYIVLNTLSGILKTKTPEEIRNIKILDPACGSGSFLIRAYRELIEYWQSQNNKKMRFKKGTHLGKIEKTIKQKEGKKILSSQRKMDILRNNIYGVDLDEKAVEIAQLNLLLKTVDKKMKLPNLLHILCGNSLISGEEGELKKYFGKNWKSKKSFDWEEKFSEVFKKEGFDVIIGNPPYIQSRNLDDNERHFYWNHYLTDTNHSDIYSFFIEKSINLLCENGFLSFIIPNTWLQTPSFKSIRSKIFTECRIDNILFFEEGARIFEDAQVSNLVITLEKTSYNKSVGNYIKLMKLSADKEIIFKGKVKQSEVNFEKGFNIFSDQKNEDILKKVFRSSIPLSSAGEIIGGLRTGDDKRFLKNNADSEEDKKLLRGRDISRYRLKWSGEYIWYRPDLMKEKQAAAPKESKIFEAPEKLLVRMITGDEIIGTYDNDGYYLLQDNLILPKNDYSIKFILTILNSKLARFIIKNTTSNIAITQSVLKDFPIFKVSLEEDKTKHDELIKLADKMLKLNRELQKFDPVMDDQEYNEIKAEIERIDKAINQKVYELYGLTEKEIKIVEGK